MSTEAEQTTKAFQIAGDAIQATAGIAEAAGTVDHETLAIGSIIEAGNVAQAALVDPLQKAEAAAATTLAATLTGLIFKLFQHHKAAAPAAAAATTAG